MLKRFVNLVSMTYRKKYLRVMMAFYSLSMLTSFINFLFYPIMARVTPATVYGEIQFLVSIMFQISVVFMALNVIIVILSVQYQKTPNILKQKIQSVSSIFNSATLLLTTIAILVLIIYRNNLQFDSIYPFIMLGLAIVSTVPFTVAVGKLQGKEEFIKAGLLSVGCTTLKLILASVFVSIGLGSSGALAGISLGQIIAVLIGVKLGHFSYNELFTLFKKANGITRKELKIISIIGVAVVISNLLIAADTIFAKLSLSPSDAGVYAGIATLAKINIFIISPLTWMVISPAVHPKKNARRITLIIALATILCVTLTVFYGLFTDLSINILLGSGFVAKASVLVLATFAMGIMALAALLNTIIAASAKLRHILAQTSLMIITFSLYVTCAGIDLEHVLIGQSIAGSVGIAYYIIYSLRQNRGIPIYEKNIN